MSERLTGLLNRLTRQESERKKQSRESESKNDSEYHKMIDAANEESALKEFVRDFR